jgi:hypothetical protein
MNLTTPMIHLTAPMNRMAINLFPAFSGTRWELLAPRRVRGSLTPIGPMNYRDEYFPRLSQAVHRAFCMKEKAKAYKDLPVLLSMIRPPNVVNACMMDPEFVYHLESEDDALFLILKYDQS